MPTTEVNNTALYYERAGHGPAMLFVHGAFGDADVWADQARRFTDRYAVVRYDRRGYSRSGSGDAEIGYALHADDAIALMEALDLAPCLIVGSSSGAAIGVEVALRRGDLLRGVVLSEPPLFSLDPDAGRAAISEVAPRIEQAIAAGGPRAATDAFLQLACPGLWAMSDEREKERYRANAEAGLTDVWSPALEVEAADLAAVAVPALVVSGSDSNPALRSVAQRLADALPDARFIELEGSGHVTYREKPDEFAAAVAAFAAEAEADRPTASAGTRS